jgi:hypothetical protein
VTEEGCQGDGSPDMACQGDGSSGINKFLKEESSKEI